MNRRIVSLDILLLGLAGVLVWIGYGQWTNARKQETKILRQTMPAKGILPPVLPDAAKPASPSEYVDIAQRTLFSKDRNPTIVIEPPPSKPEPPMPALPHYHGQMAIGEPVAILSTNSAPQKGYRVGEKVGDFKLLAFDREKITFEWNDKAVEKKLSDLVAKEAQPAQPASPAPAAAPTPAPQQTTQAPARTNSLGDNSASQAQGMGDLIGDDVYACKPGENSAPGTILSGHKKAIYTTMFGQVCKWEPTK